MIFLFVLLAGAVCCLQEEAFTEDLLLRPFPDGKVGAHFDFVVTTPASRIYSRSPDHHYDLFPKALGQILAKYAVEEFHVSLTQSHWHHDTWGYSPSPAPPGAQIWALFLPEVTSKIESLWKGLTNALSGLICASLSAVDSTNSAQPQFSYGPETVVAMATTENGSVALDRFRYAVLSREVVCTENLTPLVKTLPCGSNSGLASLLNALRVYDVNYHSLGIHVSLACDEKAISCAARDVVVKLKRTVTVVFDPMRKSTSSLHRTWSLRNLFGHSVAKSCPLASRSTVYVDATLKQSTIANGPRLGDDLVDNVTGSRWAVYANLTGGSDIAVEWTGGKIVDRFSSLRPPVRITSFASGYGQEFGQLHISIDNDFEVPLPVVLLQLVPWYFRVFLHTLRIVAEPAASTTTTTRKFNYIPAKDRVRMHSFEWALDLPAKSTVHVVVDFQCAYLKWTEHPPDARHGFYIPPAMLRFDAPADMKSASLFALPSHRHRRVYVYTKPLLVGLPTPDFSMPYNVICFVCTVVAIGFGTLHNLTTKRFVVESRKKEGMLGRLKARLFASKAKTE